MTVRRRCAGELLRLERAAEAVVVGDRDRAEADRLGVVEEILDRDRAVVRVRRVHVQVDRDPRAAGERVAVAAGDAPPAGEAAVEAVELGGDRGEGLALGVGARVRLLLGTVVVVLGEAGDGGGRELRLCVEARGCGDRGARRPPPPGGAARCPRSPGRRSPPRAGARPASPRRGRGGRGRGRRGGAARRGCPRADASAAARAPSRAARRASGSRLWRPGAPGPATRGRSAFAFGPVGGAPGRRRGRPPGSRRGIARQRPRRSRRMTRRARRSGRAASRAAPCPAGRRAARPRRSSRPRSCGAWRSARYERLGSPGSKPWTTS